MPFLHEIRFDCVLVRDTPVGFTLRRDEWERLEGGGGGGIL